MIKGAHSQTREQPAQAARAAPRPAPDWGRHADLDRRAQQASALLAAAQQQQILERKRRNAAVRRREFATLRQLRRGQLVQRPDEQASVLATTRLQSDPAKLRAPVLTLQKIDEIEAQMSRQWWSDQPSATAVPSSQMASRLPTQPGAQPVAAPSPQAVPVAAPPARPPLDNIPLLEDALPPSEGEAPAPPPAAMPAPSLEDLLREPEEKLPTLQDLFGLEKPWDGTIDKPTPVPAPVAEPVAEPVVAEPPAPARSSPAQEVPAHDDGQALLQEPQLQAAAALFASGDVDAAEQALRALIAQRQSSAPHAQLPLWLALAQLYRAANRAQAFESVALELATRFGRSPPQWFAMLQTRHGAQPSPCWAAPPTMTAQALEALQAAKDGTEPPWTLDFSALTAIDNTAAQPLQTLLQQWTDGDGQFVLLHTEQLLQLLAQRSPSGDAKVEPVWWLARMLLLRLLGEQEAFDSVALDYCVTYEVSPPWWEPPRCQCKREVPSAAAAPPPQAPSGQQQLAGIFEGDISAWLQGLHARAGEVLVLDCSQLTRMDSAAAAALLRWAKHTHAQGHAVQLHHLHYLLAAFLYQIGIVPYAKVVPRSD